MKFEVRRKKDGWKISAYPAGILFCLVNNSLDHQEIGIIIFKPTAADISLETREHFWTWDFPRLSGFSTHRDKLVNQWNASDGQMNCSTAAIHFTKFFFLIWFEFLLCLTAESKISLRSIFLVKSQSSVQDFDKFFWNFVKPRVNKLNENWDWEYSLTRWTQLIFDNETVCHRPYHRVDDR